MAGKSAKGKKRGSAKKRRDTRSANLGQRFILDKIVTPID
ncbi:hypothetical protein LCGC14_2967340 [marine sediment metagenome]|uniref:Uncharacterized protein n=1 Tax=marine sediment metagenome TaxID=412755 RepID=A0A0F8ZI74_9ZZZZ